MSTTIQFEIWPPFEAFYIQAMLFNARSAVASVGRVSSQLGSMSSKPLRDAVAELDTGNFLVDV
jgi:hypothetical protein